MKTYIRYYDWADDFTALTEAAQAAKVDALFDKLRLLRKSVNNKAIAWGEDQATGLTFNDPNADDLQDALLLPVTAAATAFNTEATT